VPVPETAVGEFRAELDRAARVGVPAHVTDIYPFLPPGRLGRDALRLPTVAVRSVPAFSVTFGHLQWFDADVV